jgi:hypothetical protein
MIEVVPAEDMVSHLTRAFMIKRESSFMQRWSVGNPDYGPFRRL